MKLKKKNYSLKWKRNLTLISAKFTASKWVYQHMTWVFSWYNSFCIDFLSKVKSYKINSYNYQFINHGLLHRLIKILIILNAALFQILQDLFPLIFKTTYGEATLIISTYKTRKLRPEKWISLLEVLGSEFGRCNSRVCSHNCYVSLYLPDFVINVYSHNYKIVNNIYQL